MLPLPPKSSRPLSIAENTLAVLFRPKLLVVVNAVPAKAQRPLDPRRTPARVVVRAKFAGGGDRGAGRVVARRDFFPAGIDALRPGVFVAAPASARKHAKIVTADGVDIVALLVPV